MLIAKGLQRRRLYTGSKLTKVLAPQNKGTQGRAFGHAGIVAAASALLVDLDEVNGP